MAKKRHHYVPKAYLNSWCDERGMVLLYRKDNPAQAISQPPDGVCFHKHYYAQPRPDGEMDHDRLENYFEKFEAKWPPIVKRLEQRDNVNDSLRDIFAFLALQRVRVPAARDASEAKYAACVKAALLNLDAAGRLPPKPEGLENIFDEADVVVNPHESIHAMVPMIQETSRVLHQIGVGVLHNRTSIPFLTSDNPVIWFDPSVAEDKMQPYVIQEGAPIVLLFPISPNMIIYGHSSKREQFAQHGLQHGELSESNTVEAMNRQISRFAYEAVFAQRPGQEAVILSNAELSPVMRTQSIPYKNGYLTFWHYEWGRRTSKPKWKDQGSKKEPPTGKGREPSAPL